MNRTQALEALKGLQRFIRALERDRVADKPAFREWRKRHERTMEICFGYRREEGMPSITSIVGCFFHPKLPLVGLNYTPVAHNTLHAFQQGWTPAVRLCRGIVFGPGGRLVAKPFEKFFNVGEHAETRDLPDEPFEATVKHDGHLGINFEFDGRRYVTTRGDFTSRTSKLAAGMLKADRDFRKRLAASDPEVTVLTEIIHPETHVHLKYRRRGFILIGAYDRRDLRDFDRDELEELGKKLGLPVTERWKGESLDDLVALTQDLSVRNREGFVVRFRNGLRVKYKFASYINLMVEAKLGTVATRAVYLMNRLLAGNLDKMIKNLPEEVYAEVEKLVAKVAKVKGMSGTLKERRQYLYGLVPPRHSTAHYRALCRKLISMYDGS